VANTLLLQAATPMVAALLAFALLRERVARATWAAMVVALMGVAVMVGDGALDGRLFGNVAGLGAVLSFAAFAVVLRAGRDADLTAALCLGGLIAAAVAAVMADDLSLTGRDHALTFLMGAVETGLGLILFTLGARYVPAGELVLLTMVEVFFGPLLVWWLFGEVPALGTLAGGALVVVAVGGQAITGLRRARS
ncbi:MAG: DMT family transporter, partial [Alphaproteobacteria bacterium]